MKVPFLELASSYDELKDEINEAVLKCLDKGYYILGSQVELFEQEFAEFCGAEFCVGVGNGLDALEIVLRANGIGTGDKVIVPANTYIATILAISKIGAAPVLIEPDPYTKNINPDNILAKLDSKTKAILAVHLYGQTADMSRLHSIANDYGLKLLEDAAQAHGATHNGKRAGSLGDGAAFSFYPSKNLGAFGDGGAIVTNSSQVAEYAKTFRNYGSRVKYTNEIKGCNSRLDEVQAAILRVKLKKLLDWNLRRAILAEAYLEKLSNLEPRILLPKINPENTSCWHLFVIQTKERDALMKHLKNNNIDTLIHYPIPPHKQKAYADVSPSWGPLPITEKMAEESISLPIGPHLGLVEVKYVCDKIIEFFNKQY